MTFKSDDYFDKKNDQEYLVFIRISGAGIVTKVDGELANITISSSRSTLFHQLSSEISLNDAEDRRSILVLN